MTLERYYLHQPETSHTLNTQRSNKIFSHFSPRNRAELLGPERINNWQIVAKFLTHRDPGTKGVIDTGRQGEGGKLMNAVLGTLSQCFVVGVPSDLQDGHRICALMYPFA